MNATSKQLALAWFELLEDKNHKDASKKMLSHLYNSGQLSSLPEIVRHLEEIEHQSRGVEHATVTTAHETTETQAKKLAKEILKEDIIVSTVINPELIGGVQIETKNKRWDLSIRKTLQQLEKQLI